MPSSEQEKGLLSRSSRDSHEFDTSYDTLLDEARKNTNWPRKAIFLCSFLAFILGALSTYFAVHLFFKTEPTLRNCDQRLSSYSTVWDHVEYSDIQLDAVLFSENAFKGRPSPGLDLAWEGIVEMYPLRVPDEAFEQLDKDQSTSVKFADELGGYMGGLEVYHQLHCLRLVRQYTYKEYYSVLPEPPQAFIDSNDTLRAHVDHCIDMIRQVLMCQSDVTLVTHHWVAGLDRPFPDFNTWHKCRNFDVLTDYARNAAVKMDMRKPKNAVELPETPQHHHH